MPAFTATFTVVLACAATVFAAPFNKPACGYQFPCPMNVDGTPGPGLITTGDGSLKPACGYAYPCPMNADGTPGSGLIATKDGSLKPACGYAYPCPSTPDNSAKKPKPTALVPWKAVAA